MASELTIEPAAVLAKVVEQLTNLGAERARLLYELAVRDVAIEQLRTQIKEMETEDEPETTPETNGVGKVSELKA